MKIGKIVSVEYDKFRVRLFHTTRNSTVNIDGKVYYFLKFAANPFARTDLFVTRA